MADGFGASSVLDVGCGTGVFACLLALRGRHVIGVDPASASLDVARRRLGGDAVRWLPGDATTLPPLQVDLVTMTGNVAQVFVDDGVWGAALDPDGRLVLEARDPAKEAWRTWTREQTCRRVDLPGVGEVETWVETTGVHLPSVSFSTTFVFASDGAVLTSDSTLRFRRRDEIVRSLRQAELFVEEVRDAPDRPGLEMVFVATKRTRGEVSGDPRPRLTCPFAWSEPASIR